MVFKRGVLLLALLMATFLVPWRVLKDHMLSRWVTDAPVLAFSEPAMAGIVPVKETLIRWTDRFFGNTAGENSTALKDQLDRALAENILIKNRLSEMTADVAVQRRFSGLTPTLITARILSFDLLPSSQTALIDKGSLHGVDVDDVAVIADGLVGKIVRTYRKTSKVLLCVDPQFAVDTVNFRTGMRAVVSGTGGRSLSAERLPFLSRIEYLQGGRDIRSGDALVTSGLGGVFPPGIPVGTVDRVAGADESLFETALVLPAVDFTRLSRMYVVRPPEEDALATVNVEAP